MLQLQLKCPPENRCLQCMSKLPVRPVCSRLSRHQFWRLHHLPDLQCGNLPNRMHRKFNRVVCKLSPGQQLTRWNHVFI